MRRTLLGLAAPCLVVLSLVAGCGAVPAERDSTRQSTLAIDPSRVAPVVERYREVRNTAISLVDPKPLSIVETGAVLDIESGQLEAADRLDRTPPKDQTREEVSQVLTPRFTRYPLWFVAVTQDESDDVARVQVFQRATAVDPWLLAANPQIALGRSLPEVRQGPTGAAYRVRPDDAAGMATSPTGAAADYAKALTAGEASRAVSEDGFLRQVRDAAQDNEELRDVTFEQEWKPQDVEFALRTSDGGALVFATLERSDVYSVRAGNTLSFPEGTAQRAFLPSGITAEGRLEYVHQVLLQVPPGRGRIQAIGQWGGIVGGSGS